MKSAVWKTISCFNPVKQKCSKYETVSYLSKAGLQKLAHSTTGTTASVNIVPNIITKSVTGFSELYIISVTFSKKI